MTTQWPKWMYQPDGKGEVFASEADVPEGEGWITWEALQGAGAPSKPRRSEPKPQSDPEPEPVADVAPSPPEPTTQDPPQEG